MSTSSSSAVALASSVAASSASATLSPSPAEEDDLLFAPSSFFFAFQPGSSLQADEPPVSVEDAFSVEQFSMEDASTQALAAERDATLRGLERITQKRKRNDVDPMPMRSSPPPPPPTKHDLFVRRRAPVAATAATATATKAASATESTGSVHSQLLPPTSRRKLNFTIPRPLPPPPPPLKRNNNVTAAKGRSAPHFQIQPNKTAPSSGITIVTARSVDFSTEPIVLLVKGDPVMQIYWAVFYMEPTSEDGPLWPIVGISTQAGQTANLVIPDLFARKQTGRVCHLVVQRVDAAEKFYDPIRIRVDYSMQYAPTALSMDTYDPEPWIRQNMLHVLSQSSSSVVSSGSAFMLMTPEQEAKAKAAIPPPRMTRLVALFHENRLPPSKWKGTT